MANEYNLLININSESFPFKVDDCALDFIQYAGPKECLPALVTFLKCCIEDGSVELNLSDHKSSTFSVSIPKRNIDFVVEHAKHVIEWSNPSRNRNIENLTKNDNANKINANAIWTEGTTKFMLEQYNKWINHVGPMKMFEKKIDMWKKISTDIEEKFEIKYTYLQVEKRYKTVCKRKKPIIDNNESTGASRMDEKEWNTIINNDDSILPEVLLSTKTVVINQKECLESNTKKLKNDNTEIMLLLDFLKKIELAEERRHKEKMDLLKSLFDKYIFH